MSRSISHRIGFILDKRVFLKVKFFFQTQKCGVGFPAKTHAKTGLKPENHLRTFNQAEMRREQSYLYSVFFIAYFCRVKLSSFSNCAFMCLLLSWKTKVRMLIMMLMIRIG